MKNKLQQHFPTIRTQEEIMTEIKDNEKLQKIFDSWHEEEQQEFLDFCTGVRGIKMLYDSFSKEILNPETHPERLNELLSLLLNQHVKILSVLPNDSTRIAEENSLIITDIVVEMENGSIANIEIQKIGYRFPGQRSACYSADLLLRQYKRVKSREKKKFSYRDIKTVYTIILFEKSTKEFHKYPDTYLHYFEQRSNSGLQMNLLQKYLFISLDIFRKKHQNNNINSKLDAWLAFLCMDDPEMILAIIEKYPEFEPIYEQAYDICRNMEEVMGMFSKELYELDKNTVQYMIDEMQEEINRKKAELAKKNEEYYKIQEVLAGKEEELVKKREENRRVQEELTKERGENKRVQEELTKERGENKRVQEELTKERRENKRVQEELIKDRDENKKQKEELQKKLSELEEKLKEKNV